MLGQLFAARRPAACTTHRSMSARRLFLEPLEQRTLLSVLHWQGGVDSSWSKPGNWLENQAPSDGDSLAFDTHTAGFANNFTPNNDLIGLTVGGIGITGGPPTGQFNISGNPITLSGDITWNGPDFARIRLDITLDANLSHAFHSDGGLDVFSRIDTNGTTLTVDGLGRARFIGVISGSGGLRFSAKGGNYLSAANTYTGLTEVVNCPFLAVVGSGSLGDTTNGTIVTNATLTLGGGKLSNEQVTLSGNRAWLSGLDGAVQAGDVTLATTEWAMIVGQGSGGETYTIRGAINGDAGTSGLIIGSGGGNTIVLSGANAYIGATTINGNGTVQSGANEVIPDGSAVTIDAATTVNLAGHSETIGSLQGAGKVMLGNAVLTTGGNNQSTTFGGILSGDGGLVKTGSGELTLSGDNTYTGPTTINAGSLVVTGTIAGPVSVESGGTLAPGRSPGVPSTGAVTLAPGSKFSVEFNGMTAGTEYGQLRAAGPVTIDNATLEVTRRLVGSRFEIIRNDSLEPVHGTFLGLLEGGTLTVDGLPYTITYTGGDGNDVELIAPNLPPAALASFVVPESSLSVFPSGGTSSCLDGCGRPEWRPHSRFGGGARVGAGGHSAGGRYGQFHPGLDDPDHRLRGGRRF